MGTRNAAVRKLAIPDMTTTVLTLTVMGHGAVVIRYSVSAALWLAAAVSALCSAALFRSLRTSDTL